MKVAIVILVLCALNFFAFLASTMKIGGSAANGTVKDGHYFVGDHGKVTEVSQRAWEISLWHSKSLFLTHPLAIILTIILGSKWDADRKQKASTGSDA